jgi:hypothetical protein
MTGPAVSVAVLGTGTMGAPIAASAVTAAATTASPPGNRLSIAAS